MSKHNKHNPKVVQPVQPATAEETPATVVAETTPTAVAPAISPEALAALIAQLDPELQALVANMATVKSPELKKKMSENVAKLVAGEKQSEDAKQWANFNKEAEAELRKLFVDLATKNNLSLKDRKIVCVFANTEAIPVSTNTIVGKASGGNGRKGGSENGFKSHGKVEYQGKEYNSKHALALAMNWKYEGRRTSAEAIEKPQDMTGKDLGFTNSIVEKDGKLFVSKVA